MFTVTRNRRSLEEIDRMLRDRRRRTGVHVRCRAHLQRHPRVADVGGEATRVRGAVGVGTSMSSTMRTPWPSRSAPQNWSASSIEGSPNASPAWIVVWKFASWTARKASRCRLGGKPASAPAMSNPTTPSSRWRIGELGDLGRLRRLAHRGERGATSPSALCLPSADAEPSWTASTTSSSFSPCSRCCSGAIRPRRRRRRRRRDPRRTLQPPGRWPRGAA